MPLDKEFELVLRLMDGLGLSKPYAGCSADEIRARMAPMEAMRKNAGIPVASETDRMIPVPGGSVAIRVYRQGVDEILPVVAYFHGGGFVLGGLDSHAHICRELAHRTGAIVVSVDYRRAPEHRFPAAVEDALAAVRWIAANASAFGGDGQRLAVAGDSSGANLATVSAMRCRDEGGPAIQFQLLAYPGTDARCTLASRYDNASGYFLTAEGIDWFFSQYLRDDSDRDHAWVSPLRAENLGSLPPGLLITAEFDPLRDEGEAYAARMAQAGVSMRVSRYDGAIHGFLGASTALGRAALSEAAEALKKALYPADQARKRS